MVMICKPQQTKSASNSGVFTEGNVRKQIAGEIAALMPLIKGTEEEKLYQAKKMVARLLKVRYSDIDNPNLRIGTRNFLLRQSNEVINNKTQRRKQAVGLQDPVSGLQRSYPSLNKDTTQKSHTPGPGSDLGNDPVHDKIPDPSEYQDRVGCIQAYVNAGYSEGASLNACNDIYGPTAASKGGTTRRVQNHGFGGGKSTTTVWTPQAGRIPLKSASVENIPSYVVLAGLEKEYSEYIANDTNIKSANVSTVNREYFGESIADLLARKRDDKIAAAEAKNNAAIKSASSKAAWQILHGDIIRD
jgi:hypothetical protein